MKWLIIVMVIYMIMAAWTDIKEKHISISLWLVTFLLQSIIVTVNCIRGKVSIEGVIMGLLPGIILLVIAIVTKEAIGVGDALSVLIIGNAIGLEETLWAIVVAMLLASAVAIGLIGIRKYSKKYEMAFLPYLLMGVIITLGENI